MQVGKPLALLGRWWARQSRQGEQESALFSREPSGAMTQDTIAQGRHLTCRSHCALAAIAALGCCTVGRVRVRAIGFGVADFRILRSRSMLRSPCMEPDTRLTRRVGEHIFGADLTCPECLSKPPRPRRERLLKFWWWPRPIWVLVWTLADPITDPPLDFGLDEGDPLVAERDGGGKQIEGSPSIDSGGAT